MKKNDERIGYKAQKWGDTWVVQLEYWRMDRHGDRDIEWDVVAEGLTQDEANEMAERLNKEAA